MNQFHIAAAIFLGCTLVAAAVVGPRFFSESAEVREGASFRTENRHLYGNPKASTIIVEFSDLECPFCARLHPILQEIVDTSGGRVAWEYRHYPIPTHPNAYTAAMLAECVADKGGQDAFFAFIARVFAEVSSLSRETLARIATEFGLSEEEQTKCQTDEGIQARIAADMAAAAKEGARGTPYSVIVKSSGEAIPVSGALPKEQWDSLLQLSE